MAVISGVVRDRQGQPVAGARVYFTKGPAPFSDVAMLTASDGTFSLGAPVAGSYEIECTSDEYPPVRVEIEVQADTPLRVDLELG